MSGMTPQEIVHELDKHIIGQHRAKRAVAIALRNRWRRAQVAEPAGQEAGREHERQRARAAPPAAATGRTPASAAGAR